MLVCFVSDAVVSVLSGLHCYVTGAVAAAGGANEAYALGSPARSQPRGSGALSSSAQGYESFYTASGLGGCMLQLSPEKMYTEQQPSLQQKQVTSAVLLQSLPEASDNSDSATVFAKAVSYESSASLQQAGGPLLMQQQQHGSEMTSPLSSGVLQMDSSGIASSGLLPVAVTKYSEEESHSATGKRKYEEASCS